MGTPTRNAAVHKNRPVVSGIVTFYTFFANLKLKELNETSFGPTHVVYRVWGNRMSKGEMLDAKAEEADQKA
jgi:hypothetical protein